MKDIHHRDHKSANLSDDLDQLSVAMERFGYDDKITKHDEDDVSEECTRLTSMDLKAMNSDQRTSSQSSSGSSQSSTTSSNTSTNDPAWATVLARGVKKHESVSVPLSASKSTFNPTTAEKKPTGNESQSGAGKIVAQAEQQQNQSAKRASSRIAAQQPAQTSPNGVNGSPNGQISPKRLKVEAGKGADSKSASPRKPRNNSYFHSPTGAKTPQIGQEYVVGNRRGSGGNSRRDTTANVPRGK